MNIPYRISGVGRFFFLFFLGLLFVGCASTEQRPITPPESPAIIPEPQVAIPEPPAKPTAPEMLVMFDFDSSIVKSGYDQEIQAHIEYMQANPVVNVTIEGHCDSNGSTEYNIVLGDKRAKAVQGMMIDSGISTARINIISRGEEYPLDEADNMAAWEQNRRVEFVYSQ